MKVKKVSICIPVYNSEPYLEECLKSVKEQSFSDYEVIVVNDGSNGLDNLGNNCKKIIKQISKKYKLDINYIDHKENKGLLEARRTGIYAAKGEYIFILDSDDKLPSNALEVLYKYAVETNADIVHGKGQLFSITNYNINENEELNKEWAAKLAKIQKVHEGELKGNDISNNYLIKHEHCGFLWGKLYKRELYLNALNNIPPMFCTMAEDVIQYYWLTKLASSYFGIDDCVYLYSNDTGVTSKKVISSIEKWEQVCSVSSVFTALYTSLQNQNIKLQKDENNAIGNLCCHYVIDNLKQLKDCVIPELQHKAYEVLCDYWGEIFVSKVKQEYIKSNQKLKKE